MIFFMPGMVLKSTIFGCNFLGEFSVEVVELRTGMIEEYNMQKSEKVVNESRVCVRVGVGVG